MRKSAALAAAVGLLLVAQAPSTQNALSQSSAPTSLAQTVRLAEQKSGGRARKVDRENGKGVEVLEVKTVSERKSAVVHVHPSTGSVVRTTSPGVMSGVFDREHQQADLADLARLEESSMTLAHAIDAAEKETGGRAIQASIEHRYGSTVFEVRVAKDWNPHKVWADAVTSKIIPVPPKGEDSDD